MLNRGDIVGGYYQIVDPIGSGGIGVIYKAIHLHLQTYVVLKRIKDEQLSKIRNLDYEARVLTRLKHAYLPKVYDFLKTDSGVYTVIDFIPGQSLMYYIRQGYQIEQRQIIIWALQLCEALDYLHTQEMPIYHSDIKPDNIMITPEGNVCLIDFNIAIDSQGQSQISGQSAGYAPPEQYLNVAPTTDANGSSTYQFNMSAPLDARSDIYSLGATLYHLITGQRPGNVGRGETVVPLSAYNLTYSEAFLGILEKCLRPDPNDRYQTAAELKEAFENVYRTDKRFASFRRTKQLLTAAFSVSMAVFIGLAALGVRQMGIDKRLEYQETVRQGGIARDGQRWEEAIAYFDSAILLFPDQVSAYYEKMLVYADQRNYSACILFGQQLLSSDILVEELDANPQERSDIFFLMGNGYFEQEDYVNAASCYESMLQYGAENPIKYRDYAICLARMMKIDQAEAVLADAVEQGLDTVSVQMVEGELDLAQGKWQPAAETFRLICYAGSSNEMTRRAYILWSRALTFGGDPEQAIAVLEEGSRVLPAADTAAITGALAENSLILAQQGGEKAAEYAQKSADAYLSLEANGMPLSDVQKLNLESAYLVLKDYGKAEEILLAMGEENPESYLPYLRLALLYAAMEGEKDNESRDYAAVRENYEKAVTYYQQAKNNGVSDPQMQVLENLMQQLISGGWFGSDGSIAADSAAVPEGGN